MKANPLVLGCIAAMLLVLESDDAEADIRYTMPGSACRSTPSTTTGANSKGWFVSSGTSSAVVHCPILRDFTGDPMTAVFVRIQDSNDSSFVPSCLAHSYSTENTFFDETPLVDHTNPGGFDSLSLDVEDLALGEHYAVAVTCLIGKNDTILNLRHIEN